MLHPGPPVTIGARRAAPAVRRAVAGLCGVVTALSVTLPGPIVLRAQEHPGTSPESALDGARVFGSRGCAGCHAINGVGARVGPDLGRLEGPPTFFGLAAAIWNHLPGMRERMLERGVRPFRLTSREVGDLAAFLSTVNAFGPRGDSTRGKRLFSEKRCVRCHQVDGVGGVVGPDLDFLSQFGSPIVVAAALWNHGPSMMDTMRSLGIQRPSFTGQDLLDLISFLESRARAPREGPFYVLPGSSAGGRKLFADKGCAQCHGEPPDFAGRGTAEDLVDFAAQMWNEAPVMVAGMRRRGMTAPTVEPDEMADLVAYLYSAQYFATSGEPTRGRALVRSQGCLACHSLNGAGADEAGDLARVRGLASYPDVLAVLWGHLTVSGTSASGTRWPSLSAKQMADVSAYLLSASGGGR